MVNFTRRNRFVNVTSVCVVSYSYSSTLVVIGLLNLLYLILYCFIVVFFQIGPNSKNGYCTVTRFLHFPTWVELGSARVHRTTTKDLE